MSKFNKMFFGLGIIGISCFIGSQAMAMSPTAPSITLLAPETYATSVKVSWTAATYSAGIYQYYIQQSTDSNFVNNVTTTTLNSSTLSYTYTSLSYNNLYYFRVYAKSNDGNPVNMNPYNSVTNPYGVLWSAITRTICLPAPANSYNLPTISTISHSAFNVQDGFYYTYDHNPTISWTTPSDWPSTQTAIFTKIAAGTSHTIGLKSDGTVWAWGRNNYGQLGDGYTADCNYPVQVKLSNGTPLTNIIAITTGANHSIAVKGDGTVWAWGYNNYSQLGDGSTTNRINPVQITALSGIIALAAGDSHSIALKSDGTVWVWGYDNNYQLGDNATATRTTPYKLTTISNITAIAAGSFHTLALQNDGTVWTWGYNNCYQIGNGTTTTQKTPYKLTMLSGVIAIAAGTAHSIALQTGGFVWTWGNNSNGQIGNGSGGSGIYQTTPAKLAAISTITAIAAGANHTIALQNDGTALTWGSNSNGQLGNGTITDQKTPLQVKCNNGTTLSNVNIITGGSYSTLALKNDGTIWTCGQNNYGQLGDGSRIQKMYPIQAMNILFGIAGGDVYSMYLKSDGTVWTWGDNSFGQLGDGTLIGRNIPGQVKMADGTALTNIVAIAGQGYHTIALKNDGTVWTWGLNSYGQLGIGITTNQTNPVQVKLADGTVLANITAITGGYGHTVALKNDGTVWAWGYNYEGEAGIGTTATQKNPVQVKLANGTFLTNISAIVAGGYHTIALKNDGTVWAWGRNLNGQVGNGTSTNQKNPVQVKLVNGTALTNIITIAGGGWHTIAIKDDGTTWTWGINLYGQLGDGTTVDKLNPVQAKLFDGKYFTNSIAITGGETHTVILKNDGTVWACGRNLYGQLGDGTTINQNYPVQTKQMNGTSLTNISAIAVGCYHTIALQSNQTIWFWGDDYHGELGDGMNLNESNPVKALIANRLNIMQYNEQSTTYTEYAPLALDGNQTFTQTNWNLPDGKYVFNVGCAVNGSEVWSPGYKLAVVTLPPPTQVNSITSVSTILNNKPNYQTTITVAPVIGVPLYRFYRRKSTGDNIGPVECLTSSGITTATYTDTNLAPHAGLYEYGYSTYHSSGLESDIKWCDSNTVVSPNQNGKVYVPNIAPNPTVTGPRSIVVYTDVTFKLGAAKDQENDQLEYRLYLRNKGETDWGQPYQIVTPTSDNQSLTIPLVDKSNYEWYLSCIESDSTILDRTEVTVISSSSLYIDIHYPLPLCTNALYKDVYDNMWGTKGQSLSFRVECNPQANFQTFVWDFGDGTPTQSGQFTTHTYNSLRDSSNPFNIVVTATDDLGNQYQGIAHIAIVNTPEGKLFADETWSGTQVIKGDVIVPAGITLTIVPGTQVQVYPGCGLLVYGNLQVGNGATFDWIGGSSWKGIRFYDSGTGIIDGATISHAVRGVSCTGSGKVTLENNTTLSYNNTGVHCFSGNISILGCYLLNNDIYGIKEDNSCKPLVQNCIFQLNGIPYYDWNLFKISIDQLNTDPNTGNLFN